MFFLFIRFLPVVIPVVYFCLLQVLLFQGSLWPWLLALALLINAVYFILLFAKVRQTKILAVLGQSLAVVGIGFVYAMLLSNKLTINLFTLVWSLAYLIYLESAFHQFYQTKKIELIDFNHVAAYLGLTAWFLLVATLGNFYFFIGISIWWCLAIMFLAGVMILAGRLVLLTENWRSLWIYTVVLSFILSQMFWVLLLLPASFLVIALALSAVYYVLSSLTAFKLQGKLTRPLIWQYLIFALVVVVLALMTAAWS